MGLFLVLCLTVFGATAYQVGGKINVEKYIDKCKTAEKVEMFQKEYDCE